MQILKKKSRIAEYKEKYPLYKDIPDEKLAGIIYDKTPGYQKTDREKFINIATFSEPGILSGNEKKPIDEYVPAPEEVKEIFSGDLALKNFNKYEGYQALLSRKALGLDVPINVLEAIEGKAVPMNIGEKAQTAFGTQGFIRDVAEEVIPPSRGGPLEILPESLFGVPTADIPREAVKEVADLVGLALSPKQIMVLNPVFKLAFKTLGYTGKKAFSFIKKVINDLNTPSGLKSSETVVEKLAGIIYDKVEKTIPNSTMSKGAVKEIGEQEARLIPNIPSVQEAGIGTGEAFNPVLDTTRKALPKAKPEAQGAGSRVYAETGEGTHSGVYAETGGFAESEIAQKPPFIEMPELVEIAKNLTGGKYPDVKRKLMKRENVLGVAKVQEGTGSATIELRADMFQDPVVAAKVLAHEIGHVVDWLPKKTMKHGNILGKIASLKKYTKNLLEEYPGAKSALTPKDRAKLKKIAERMARRGQTAAPEVKPEDVLAIWRDVNSFENNRALNDYIAKLSREKKSELMKTAIKGKLPDWADFGQVYKDAAPDIKKIYQKLLSDEIKKLKLIEKDIILKELKNLTQKWKPFQEGLDPKYTKYRYSNPELYADAVSVLLNSPELLKKTSPTFYKAFFNFLERKPEFKKAYLDILERSKVGLDEVLQARHKARHKAYHRGEKVRREMADPEPMNIWNTIKKEIIDNNAPRIEQVKRAKKRGAKILPADNPIYWAEEYPYTHAAYFEYLRDIENSVISPVKKIGLTAEYIGELLELRGVATQKTQKAAPLGQNIRTATEQDIPFLEKKHGGEKFKVLSDAVDKYTNIRQSHIISVLKKAEMYDDTLMAFLEQNRYYSRRNVIDYMEKKYGSNSIGKLYERIGTMKESENPLFATLQIDGELIRSAAIKMERKTFIDMMSKEFPEEILPAKKEWNGKFHAPVESDDLKRKMVTFLHKGEVKGYYLPKEIAENFLKGDLEAGKIVRALGYLTAPLKSIFVGKNPFWTAWNLQRDTRAFAKNLPGADLSTATWYTLKSVQDAFKDVVLKKSTKEVSEMYRQKMLLVGRYYAALDTGPEKAMDKLMRSYGMSGEKYESKVIKPFVKFWDYLGVPGAISERAVKIGGYKYLKTLPVERFPSAKMMKKGMGKVPEGHARQGIGLDVDKEIGHMVRSLTGSPDFFRKGHLSPLYNNIYLFSNAGKEGWRASIEAAKQDPLSYTWKTVKYDLLPKLLMFGAAAGWASKLSPEIKTMYDNIPEHDKSNYICIPLGLTSTDRTIYMVIPHDFMGQSIAGAFWKLLNTRTTQDTQEVFDFVTGGMPYSSINPVISTFFNTGKYIAGRNPYDSWNNRNVIPESVFTEGGMRSHKEYAKHLWNTLGGSVAYRFKHDTVEGAMSEFEKLYKLPVAGVGLRRFIRVSDRGIGEIARKESKIERRERAKVTNESKDALYKILDKKKLTEKDMLALVKNPEVFTGEAAKMAILEKLGAKRLKAIMSAPSLKARIRIIEKFKEEGLLNK